jgi:hypothetical protein
MVSGVFRKAEFDVPSHQVFATLGVHGAPLGLGCELIPLE